MVNGIYATMQEGMIFEKLGKFFEDKLGEFWCKPLSCCNVCMTPWYGSVLYLLLPIQNKSVEDAAITLVAAMGFNVMINKFSD